MLMLEHVVVVLWYWHGVIGTQWVGWIYCCCIDLMVVVVVGLVVVMLGVSNIRYNRPYSGVVGGRKIDLGYGRSAKFDFRAYRTTHVILAIFRVGNQI